MRRGFTLVELLVVVAVLAILVGLLIPAISMVRSSALRAQCLSNLRQIGMAIEGYASDHNGLLVSQKLITGTVWRQLIIPYTQAPANNKPWLVCKAQKFGSWTLHGYGFNATWDAPGWKHSNWWDRAHSGWPAPAQDTVRDAVTLPSNRVLVADADDWHFKNARAYFVEKTVAAPTVAGGSSALRHRGMAAYLFHDLHAAGLPWSKARLALYEPSEATGQ